MQLTLVCYRNLAQMRLNLFHFFIIIPYFPNSEQNLGFSKPFYSRELNVFVNFNFFAQHFPVDKTNVAIEVDDEN